MKVEPNAWETAARNVVNNVQRENSVQQLRSDSCGNQTALPIPQPFKVLDIKKVAGQGTQPR